MISPWGDLSSSYPQICLSLALILFILSYYRALISYDTMNALNQLEKNNPIFEKIFQYKFTKKFSFLLILFFTRVDLFVVS